MSLRIGLGRGRQGQGKMIMTDLKIGRPFDILFSVTHARLLLHFVVEASRLLRFDNNKVVGNSGNEKGTEVRLR